MIVCLMLGVYGSSFHIFSNTVPSHIAVYLIILVLQSYTPTSHAKKVLFFKGGVQHDSQLSRVLSRVSSN